MMTSPVMLSQDQWLDLEIQKAQHILLSSPSENTDTHCCRERERERKHIGIGIYISRSRDLEPITYLESGHVIAHYIA